MTRPRLGHAHGQRPAPSPVALLPPAPLAATAAAGLLLVAAGRRRIPPRPTTPPSDLPILLLLPLASRSFPLLSGLSRVPHALSRLCTHLPLPQPINRLPLASFCPPIPPVALGSLATNSTPQLTVKFRQSSRSLEQVATRGMTVSLVNVSLVSPTKVRRDASWRSCIKHLRFWWQAHRLRPVPCKRHQHLISQTNHVRRRNAAQGGISPVCRFYGRDRLHAACRDDS